jgi:hypothetical protein
LHVLGSINSGGVTRDLDCRRRCAVLPRAIGYGHCHLRMRRQRSARRTRDEKIQSAGSLGRTDIHNERTGGVIAGIGNCKGPRLEGSGFMEVERSESEQLWSDRQFAENGRAGGVGN